MCLLVWFVFVVEIVGVVVAVEVAVGVVAAGVAAVAVTF